jgi:signal transduction histidine kinase/ActR/RegA family two-component response regulator
VEATGRREAEVALREVRAELGRRIDAHTTELRMLAERVQQEAAARKEAEAALRHARGNVRRRAGAHRAEMRALRGDLERETEARQKAEAALQSGPSEPELRIEALDAEIRALTERLEHETASRKHAETTVRDARTEFERCVEAYAQERRALADALARERAGREESEHALGIKHAAEVAELEAQVRSLSAVLGEESARREHAEATLESSRAAVHASGDHLLGAVRRHLRVMMNAAATVASTAGQRSFVTALTKAIEASLPTGNGAGGLDAACESHGDPIEFRFRDTVRDTLEPLTERARRHGLELMWQIAPQVPDVVTGWPHRLRQVLVNLADNAIAFTKEGEVTVRIDAASWIPGRAVLLVTVADSGIGIAPEQQQRLFDVLARADEALAMPATDTRIGLAVSGHLVKSMGGRIWFESEKDTGTTFYFTAPLTARDTTSCAASASTNGVHHRTAGTPSGDRTKPCVLLADDTPEDQERAARLLEGRGYRVVAVRDGREALAALEEEPIDLALTDLRMPRMDGFELAAAIRTAEWAGAVGGAPVPIVALALASGGVAERERCTAVGIDGCVTKPIQAGDLLTAVERALAQR